MIISSRTPEGDPNRCRVCGKDVRTEPSEIPLRDAPCPHCGSLLWFAQAQGEAPGTVPMPSLPSPIDVYFATQAAQLPQDLSLARPRLEQITDPEELKEVERLFERFDA